MWHSTMLPSTTQKGLESALPREWAALVLVVVLLGLLGGVILGVTCVLHERVVVRRVRARRRGSAGVDRRYPR